MNNNFIKKLSHIDDYDYSSEKIITLIFNPLNTEWVNIAKEMDGDNYSEDCFIIEVFQDKETKKLSVFECLYLLDSDNPRLSLGFLSTEYQQITKDYIINNIPC